MAGSFWGSAFSKWLGGEDDVVAAAREVMACTGEELGVVHFQRYRTNEDGPERMVLAGAVFETDDDAEAFIGSLIVLLRALEEAGDDA